VVLVQRSLRPSNRQADEEVSLYASLARTAATATLADHVGGIESDGGNNKQVCMFNDHANINNNFCCAGNTDSSSITQKWKAPCCR
jgi:hypothetical protein